jgi:hypothetical protein
MIHRRTGPAGGLWLFLVTLLAAGLAGCTGEYEKRLGARTDELRNNSDFKVLTKSVPFNFPAASVTLALPADLIEVDAKADPQRLKLMLAAPLADNNLSEMRTFEGEVKDQAGGKQHYYLYVGSINLAAGGNDDMELFRANVRNVARALSPMQDVQVPTRDGLMVTCHKCRAVLPQVFYYTKPDGSGAYPPPVEGLIEIWDYPIESAKKHLVLVWRAPTVQDKDFIDLDKKAKLIAGGISVLAK